MAAIAADHHHRRLGPAGGAALCALGLLIAAGLWAMRTPEGGQPWGWPFVGGQAVAFAAYAGALALIRRRTPADWRWLAVIIVYAVGLRVVTWVRAPDLSTDIYRYIWDGRVTNHGINPYRFAPLDPEVKPLRDDLWRRINFKRIPTIYPPAAQLLFAGLWRADPDHPQRTFRLAFLLCDLAAVVVLWRLLVRSRRPSAWLLAYAWHPLVITEFVGGGHLDSVAIALLLAAFALAPASRRSTVWSAAALGLSIMTKGYALLALPFLVKRYGWRYLAWTAAVCAVVAAPFVGAGRAMFGGLDAYVLMWHENASVLLVIERAFVPYTDLALIVAKGVVTAILLGFMVWLLARRSPGEESPLRDTFALFAGGLLLGGPVLPWYVAWTAPFLCLWPVAGWVLFTGLAPIAYYSHWSLGKEWVPIAQGIEYGVVYAALISQAIWRLVTIRRTGRAASARR